MKPASSARPTRRDHERIEREMTERIEQAKQRPGWAEEMDRIGELFGDFGKGENHG